MLRRLSLFIILLLSLIMLCEIPVKAQSNLIDIDKDMIWTWWFYPQVLSTDSYIYWGYTSSNGDIGVAQYEIGTGITKTHVFAQNISSDDHTSTSVARMKDGRILCAYTNWHNASDKKINIMLSTSPDNISSFDHVILNSSKKTCYTQLLSDSHRWYVFYRTGSKRWAMQYSSDGINWSGEKILITAPVQYYCKFTPTNKKNVFRVCMYPNPLKGINDIRLGFFHTKNRSFYSSDNKTFLGKTKVSFEQFPIIIQNEKDIRHRVLDIAITPVSETTILMADMYSDRITYRLYKNGEYSNICDSYKYLKDGIYPGGACFIRCNNVAISRSDGESDYIDLYDISNNSPVFISSLCSIEIGANNYRLARPIADINGLWLMWQKGYYNPKSYKDFLTNPVIIKMP